MTFAGLPVSRPHESTIRVVVADDVSLFRRQLIVGLERGADLEVLAEATDTDSLVTQVAELTPDVVIVGMQLPTYGALGAVAALDEVAPEVGIIVVTTPDDGPELIRVARAAAIGFVDREVAVDRAVAVSRIVGKGRSVLTAPVAAALLEDYASLDRQTGSLQQQLVPPRLDPNEQRVLEQLRSGASPSEAAKGMGVTQATAVNLATNALRKLQGHARDESAISRGAVRSAAMA